MSELVEKMRESESYIRTSLELRAFLKAGADRIEELEAKLSTVTEERDRLREALVKSEIHIVAIAVTDEAEEYNLLLDEIEQALTKEENNE